VIVYISNNLSQHGNISRGIMPQ